MTTMTHLSQGLFAAPAFARISGATAAFEGARRMEQFTGSVRRLVFRNPESTYTVLRLAPNRLVRLRIVAAAADAAGPGAGPQQESFLEDDTLPKLITVVGDFAHVEVGQQLWVAGEWIDHPLHG